MLCTDTHRMILWSYDDLCVLLRWFIKVRDRLRSVSGPMSFWHSILQLQSSTSAPERTSQPRGFQCFFFLFLPSCVTAVKDVQDVTRNICSTFRVNETPLFVKNWSGDEGRGWQAVGEAIVVLGGKVMETIGKTVWK